MIRLEADTPGYRFVTWEDTAVVVWREAPTVDSAVKMYSFLKALTAERKAAIYILVVIGESTGLPDADARKAMAESMEKTAPFTREIVGVVEGGGFRSAAIRSVASSVQLFARKTAPMKTLSDVEAAIDALLKRRGTVSLLERAELASAVRLARTGTR